MSADFIEMMWTQFGIETDEHLEQLERLLLSVEGVGAVDAEGISQLFRSFHSFKGLAKAMDLNAMEAVAHRCEDLLGLVRAGTAPLDREMAGLLIEATDALKDQRGAAVATRADCPIPVALVKRLRNAYGLHTGEGPPKEEAPVATPSPSSAAIHEDPDMLSFFVDLVRDHLPLLVDALNDLWTNSDPSGRSDSVAAVAAMVDANLETLEYACEVMDFAGLEFLIRALRTALPKDGVWAETTKDGILTALRDLHELLRHMETEFGLQTGCEPLAAFLSRHSQGDLGRRFTALLAALEALPEAGAEAGALCARMMADLSVVAAQMRTLVPAFAPEGLLFLRDLLGRAPRNQEEGLPTEGVLLGRALVEGARQIYSMRKEEDRISNLPALMEEQRRNLQELRILLWNLGISVASSGQTGVGELLAGLGISQEFAGLLSLPQVNALREAQEQRLRVYVIAVCLELPEDVATELLECLRLKGRVVTNRSVFIAEEGWYEILVIWPLSHEELFAEIRRLDPGGRLIRIQGEEAPGDPPLPGIGGGVAGTPSVPMETAPPLPAVGETGGQQALRVSGEALDRFMNQIGDLVFIRSQVVHAMADERVREAMACLRRMSEGRAEGQWGARELVAVVEALEEQHQRIRDAESALQSALSRLQDSVMLLRVVPMDTVFRRFPRVVRDLARHQGKQVRLLFVGEEVKIDKAMVEVLADPLLHMVRNGVDHGIETPAERARWGKPAEATLQIQAFQEGNRVVVRVIDDGRGIDPVRVLDKARERCLVTAEDSRHLSAEEIYQFLFLPGFSMAAEITEISGRGVGMDVVRSNVTRIGGSIRIQSELGKGTTFTLTMPLSAAVQQVLMVRAAGRWFALPRRHVAEIIEVDPAEIQTVRGRAAVLLRDRFLPIHALRDLLCLPAMPGGNSAGEEGAKKGQIAVVIADEQRRLAIQVEAVAGGTEIFVKDVHAALANFPGISGAAILGNGQVVLILEAGGLFDLASRTAPPSPASPAVGGVAGTSAALPAGPFEPPVVTLH